VGFITPRERGLKSYLRREISATGFPLEIEISSILDRDWIVYNNDPYVDEDKTREIDIFAVHPSSLFTEEQKRRDIFILTSNLVIECKKATTHAWVFFTRPRPSDWEPGLPGGHSFDFLEAFSHGKQSFLDEIRFPKTHYDTFPRVAYNCVEVKLTKDIRAETKEIFEAQNQLWKCLTYDCKCLREELEKDRSSRFIALYFPAIVLDGDLFEATGSSRSVRLTERHHMLLSFSRRSRALGSVKDFLVDIVRKDNFREYTSTLQSDISAIRDYFKANRERFASQAEAFVEKLP
jgi:hypothetical protein